VGSSVAIARYRPLLENTTDWIGPTVLNTGTGLDESLNLMISTSLFSPPELPPAITYSEHMLVLRVSSNGAVASCFGFEIHSGFDLCKKILAVDKVI